MKLSRIADSRFRDVLRKLMKEPLPIRAAFKLKNLISRVDEEFEKYEEMRKVAVECFGTKTKDGTLALDKNGNAKFSEENMKQFVAELNELLVLEIEIEKITLAEVGEKVTISAEDLMLISDVLDV